MPENPDGQFSSMRGRRFDTEHEAVLDNREFVEERMAREQRTDQEITDATTVTCTQLGCLSILVIVGFCFPPLWLICLGLGYWIIRRIR